MGSLKDLLNAATVVTHKVDEISREELNSILDKYNFAAVRGLIRPEDIEDTKTKVRAGFRVENDYPATGETPEDLYKNYQKFSVGGGELRERDMPKCLRTFYNPIFADDIYGMRDSFRQAAKVRNLLMGLSLDFAIEDIEDRFWTASRIHHYPAGGGFMGAHLEDYIPLIYEKYGIKSYYQPLIIMSKKGTGEDCDFETGGGFFETTEQRYYYEEECELGDIVIYNTSILHGVSEVDVLKGFRQDSMEGRFAGFVTMYRDFSNT